MVSDEFDIGYAQDDAEGPEKHFGLKRDESAVQDIGSVVTRVCIVFTSVLLTKRVRFDWVAIVCVLTRCISPGGPPHLLSQRTSTSTPPLKRSGRILTATGLPTPRPALPPDRPHTARPQEDSCALPRGPLHPRNLNSRCPAAAGELVGWGDQQNTETSGAPGGDVAADY
jgi:hypothetical protein